jgi:hypothetical protein
MRGGSGSSTRSSRHQTITVCATFRIGQLCPESKKASLISHLPRPFSTSKAVASAHKELTAALSHRKDLIKKAAAYLDAIKLHREKILAEAAAADLEGGSAKPNRPGHQS